MTIDEILEGVLVREGGFRPAVRRPDGSWDPDTMYGITSPVLGEWRGLGRRATTAELKAMSVAEARAIYEAQYITGPGFVPDAIPFEPLRVCVIDFGVNSGPFRAARYLQRVLRLVRPEVAPDGVVGPKTRQALRELHGFAPWINDALCAARVQMIEGAVVAGRIRKKDRNGLIARALSFVLSRGES